jgi:hypothetical protein
MRFIISAILIQFVNFSTFMKRIGHHLAFAEIEKGAIFYLSAFESLNILTILWFMGLQQSLGLPIMIIPYLFVFYQINNKCFIKNGKYKQIVNERFNYTKWQRNMSTVIGIMYLMLSITTPIIYNEFFK